MDVFGRPEAQTALFAYWLAVRLQMLRVKNPRELLTDSFIDQAMMVLAAVHLIRWMVGA
ncbi:MAG: hypothetical protein QXH35_05190 [Nitrososphaerota archaeon]